MPNRLAWIIEDDSAIADVYTETLCGAGFAAEVIRSGRVALERLGNPGAVPALVVLDLNLPFVAGETLLKRLRAERWLAGVRVTPAPPQVRVVTTGEPHRAESLHSQADLVLIKPVSANQLGDLAARLVQ